MKNCIEYLMQKQSCGETIGRDYYEFAGSDFSKSNTYAHLCHLAMVFATYGGVAASINLIENY